MSPPRSTAELIVLVFAGALAVGFLVAVVGIVTLELIDPANDTTAATQAVGGIFTALLGACVGYLIGRRSLG